jgi:GTP pyrophosphokinase
MAQAPAPTRLGPRYGEAVAWAVRLHDGQVRKGTGIPYAAHVLAVSAIALEHGADEDVAIAALLHDSVEDCGGELTGELVAARFGPRVARIVAGCTDATVTPKPPWAARKAAYLAHLPGASPDVLLVSASDKLHNARSILTDHRRIGDAIWGRFTGGREGSLWYYRSLVAAYERAGTVPPALLAELDGVVGELEALGGFRAEPYPAPAPGTG